MTAPIPPIRVGLGYDTHRLGNGGPLRLGGIDIDCQVHCIGHSDADVLLHAVTDAILGSIAEQDIGRLFPDNADENLNRDSAEFLHEAIRRLRDHGMEIANMDCVILAERPKMAVHIDAMKAAISDITGTPNDSHWNQSQNRGRDWTHWSWRGHRCQSGRAGLQDVSQT